MNYLKNAWLMFDNYIIARWQNRPSTALFWYLPEPSNLQSEEDLMRYQQSQQPPFYLIDYRKKLHYSLENKDGIIVLPYNNTIGEQVNPEASFQYALGLHDQFYCTKDSSYMNKFLKYVDYFFHHQTQEGMWGYHFDWYGSQAPWYSALAQSRGASVMLRAWLHTQEEKYLTAAKNALQKFTLPTQQQGFLHVFTPKQCHYFEEYPQTPTGVINGFMASLLSIWELRYWINEPWLDELWTNGIHSLEQMLPYYTNGWWSLYDLDTSSPILNVNSPRYHLLEISYLQILGILSNSAVIKAEHANRIKQYNNIVSRFKALLLKSLRKIIYR